MSSSFDASLLVAVLTPGAGTHVTKRPQQCWAVSLLAVNACLSTGWQHPPDHGWQGRKAMPGRATRPPAIGGAHKVTGHGAQSTGHGELATPAADPQRPGEDDRQQAHERHEQDGQPQSNVVRQSTHQRG